MPKPTRTQVFVSYCHKDRKLMDEFKTMLAPAIQRGQVDLWDDTRIQPGARWRDEIQQAMTSARIAVLLVSPGFLASDFIAKKELPPLLEAARREGVTIFWFYLSSCLFEQTAIAEYQAAHNISRPLDRLSKAERQAVLSEACALLLREAAKPMPAASKAVVRPSAEANQPSQPRAAASAPPVELAKPVNLTSQVMGGAAIDPQVRILFLAANPGGTERLLLDEEARQIETKVRAAAHRDSLTLITRWALRPDDLLQYLNEHRPHVVHFSGHGTEADEIILQDDQQRPKPVGKAALTALFKTLKDNIRVVVLNACYSKAQAEAIAAHVDCVVGMKTEIGDTAAIAFAGAFYRAIGFGRSVQDAFDQGLASLALENIPEEDAPELLVRAGVDPGGVILVNPR